MDSIGDAYVVVAVGGSLEPDTPPGSPDPHESRPTPSRDGGSGVGETAERELLSFALAMQQAVQAIDKAISSPSSQTEGGDANFQAASAWWGEMGKERRLRLRIGVAEGNVIAGVRLLDSERTARHP